MRATPPSRIALGIEYCGTHYHGWQRQASGIETVQSRVEIALGTVANHDVSVICAGRTDTGVHASSQVIHFDTHATRKLKSWVYGTNSHLPDDISVQWARSTACDFHARFSAISRKYNYLIYNSKVRSALYGDSKSREFRPLNAEKMHEAGQYLLGENDFSSFRAAGCQSNTPMRNVMSLSVSQQANVINIEIVANAFLHHMVRNIAGLLMDIGAGEKDPVAALRILQAKDRTKSSKTAPPEGLYLSGVSYPQRFELPEPQPLSL